MRIKIPVEEWVLIKDKTEELPFGKEVTTLVDNVAWRAEAIFQSEPDSISKQKTAWSNATQGVYQKPYGDEIFQEVLLMLVTVWELGEWFFQEVLSPLEQQVFYSTVENRMVAAKETQEKENNEDAKR